MTEAGLAKPRSPLRSIPGNRIISESTGLCKLQLSPKRDRKPVVESKAISPRVSHKRSILHIQPAQPEPSKPDLLTRYAQKQAKLMELENQAELIRFELLEIQAQLEEPSQAVPALQPVETPNRGLKKKVSSIFQAPQAPTLRKQASKIFSSPEPAALKQKASMMFNNSINNSRFLSDVREKIDQQSADFEQLTKRGSELARNFLGWSPVKEGKKERLADVKKEQIADSSFMFDNLDSKPRDFNKSILLSEEESESSLIDIDDYDSDDSEASVVRNHV